MVEPRIVFKGGYWARADQGEYGGQGRTNHGFSKKCMPKATMCLWESATCVRTRVCVACGR